MMKILSEDRGRLNSHLMGPNHLTGHLRDQEMVSPNLRKVEQSIIMGLLLLLLIKRTILLFKICSIRLSGPPGRVVVDNSEVMHSVHSQNRQ